MSTNLREGHAISADGTCLGYRVLGSGPPAVFVHGSLATGEQWSDVAHQLARQHTCYLLDRRGRGRSDEADETAGYGLAAEASDLAAMLEVAGPNATLVAHSYGAICALHAVATQHVQPARMVLYEPPLPIHGPTAGETLTPLTQAVGAGNLDTALTLGLTHILRLPDTSAQDLQQSPLWDTMRALAPTWPRELRGIDASAALLQRYAAVPTPTLFLLGTATAAHHASATTFLAEHLAESTVTVLDGHGHLAHIVSPTLVADTIAGFLNQRAGDALPG